MTDDNRHLLEVTVAAQRDRNRIGIGDPFIRITRGKLHIIPIGSVRPRDVRAALQRRGQPECQRTGGDLQGIGSRLGMCG